MIQHVMDNFHLNNERNHFSALKENQVMIYNLPKSFSLYKFKQTFLKSNEIQIEMKKLKFQMLNDSLDTPSQLKISFGSEQEARQFLAFFNQHQLKGILKAEGNSSVIVSEQDPRNRTVCISSLDFNV